MVADISRSLEFYVRGLGFRTRLEWKPGGKLEWCWLERDGVAFMLQQYRQGNMPHETPGVGITICVICEDALTLYDEYVRNGLTPEEPFVGNNMWVVSLKDPDGYTVLFESDTDVPEGTSYSAWVKKQVSGKSR